MNEPDYSKYSLNELQEALASIDRDSYPDRYKKLIAEIQKRDTAARQAHAPGKVGKSVENPQIADAGTAAAAEHEAATLPPAPEKVVTSGHDGMYRTTSVQGDNLEFELAPRGTRLGAALIDMVLLLIIVWPLMMLFDITYDRIAAQDLSTVDYLIIFVVSQSVFLALHGYLLIRFGQTVGKKLTAIRIINEEGQVPNVLSVYVIRYLFMAFLGQIPVVGSAIGMINILFIFRQDRRCGHDLLAGTRVVNV